MILTLVTLVSLPISFLTLNRTLNRTLNPQMLSEQAKETDGLDGRYKYLPGAPSARDKAEWSNVKEALTSRLEPSEMSQVSAWGIGICYFCHFQRLPTTSNDFQLPI